MRITPLEIRRHAFARRLQGYDRDEVQTFLNMVADDYEAMVHKLEELRTEAKERRARVEHLESHETVLQKTLTTAQTLSEDLKKTAVKEAELLLGEAEIRGEKILDAAHRRAAKLSEDIREMKLLRTRLAAAVRSAFETHLRLLEGLADDAPDDKLF